MIKQIHKLALTCASLSILANVQADGKLNLTLIPTAKPQTDPALAKPFSLCDTPEGLQAGLADAMEKIVASRETLEEQALATATVLQMAAKESAAKGASALQGKTGKSKPTASSNTDADGGEEDHDEGDGAGTAATSNSTAATPAAASTVLATAGGMNLFTA